MEILHRDDLKRGGFAGLRETRLVMDRAFLAAGRKAILGKVLATSCIWPMPVSCQTEKLGFTATKKSMSFR